MESNRVILTPSQCKMARAGLDFGVRDVAALAGVSPNTVARLERGEVLRDDTLRKIRESLAAEGAIFLSSVGGGIPSVGVMCVEVLGPLRYGPAVSAPAHDPSHAANPDLEARSDVSVDPATARRDELFRARSEKEMG